MNINLASLAPGTFINCAELALREEVASVLSRVYSPPG